MGVNSLTESKTLSDKFRELARELEADQDEARRGERIEKLARGKPASEGSGVRALSYAIGALFAFVGAPSAQAAPTGNGLLAQCTSERGSNTYWQDTAACTAYIQGFIEGAVSFQTMWPKDEQKFICLPPNVTAGQLRDIVVK